MALDWMNFDYTAHGGQGHNDGGGFGKADLNEMLRLNYTPNQIKILANLAPSQGVKVYKPVQKYAESVAKPPWMYGKYGDAAFGIKDINAAQGMPGVNYQTIKGYADFATEKGIGVHQGAKDWLTNNDPAVLGANKTPGGGWMHFDYDAVGGPGIGVKDIDKMQSEGYSAPQIRILSNTASDKGVKVHSGASDWVKENTEKPPWMYGKYGQEHFGIADIDAALSQGADLDTIKGYADFARKTGIGVGIEAENWMRGEEMPEMPEMPEIQFPGTQTGARNVSNYNALGIRSPRPEGWDLNTGGTTAAFGRKKKPKNTTGALLINPLT